MTIMYRIVLPIVTLLLFFHTRGSDIVIRLAQESDLAAILELDRKVSFEFFKPVFITGYPDTYGKDVDALLLSELEEDIKTFKEHVKNEGNHRLIIAHNTTQNKPIGFILLSKENQDCTFIDLLMVDHAFRGKGIGKQLISAARNAFCGTRSLTLYTLRFANDATQKFYEKLGFVPIEFESTGVRPYSAQTHLHYILYV